MYRSRYWVRGLLAVLTVGLIATMGISVAAAQAPVTLTFWNGFTGPDRPGVEALVKQFNDAHPDIQVDMSISPWDSLMQNLLTQLSTGQGPDIMGIDPINLPNYAQSGYVSDISDVFAPGSEMDPKNFPPAYIDLLKYNGKFYGAPMTFATLMMYYNKDLFSAAGLDPNKPPTDWNTWIDDIKKLTDSSKGQYGIALAEHDTIPNWPLLIWGNGGDIIRNGKSALADPKTIEALTTWGNLVTQDGISPYGLSGADADKLFQTGKAAMEITGPWQVQGYLDAKLNFDVTPPPAGPAGPVTAATADVLMINSASQHQAEAKEFIKFWDSQKSQAFYSNTVHFPPARTDIGSMLNNPWSAKFAAAAPYSRFYLGGLTVGSQIDTSIVVPMVESITQGQSSAQDAATSADQQLTQLLEANPQAASTETATESATAAATPAATASS